MLRIATNDPQDSLAFNDLAIITDPSYGRFYFHCSAPYAAVIISLAARQKSDPISFIPEGDAAARQIIRGQLHPYFISRKDPDKIHADLSGNMGQDLMPILQFDTEHCIGQRFRNDSLDFNRFFFGHRLLLRRSILPELK